MRDVHPSPSASTGQSILKSVFIKRTDPVERYIECAQCGYNINLDSQAQGPVLESDTSDGPGIVNQSQSVTTTNTLAELPQPLKSLANSYIGTFQYTEPEYVSGCPFCGTYNGRAVGRDSDPFMSNTRDFRNAW